MSITLKTIDFNYDSTNGGNISQVAESLEVNQTDGVFENAKISFILSGPKYMADTYLSAAHTWTKATKLAEKAARQDIYTYLAVQTGYPNGVAHWDYDDGSMGPPLHLVTMTAQGNNAWKADCTFEYPQLTDDDQGQKVDPDINKASYVEPSVSSSQFEYSSSGESAHIIRSINTIGYYSPTSGYTAPNMNGFIGWNGSDYDGVDVQRPTVKFSFSVNRPLSAIDQSTRLTYSGMVGCTNISPFLGFAAGDVLFTGFSASRNYVSAEDEELGAQEQQSYWRVTYSFEASPGTYVNGDEETGIYKAGFDYLWQYSETTATSDGNEQAIPVGIYVEQVYPRVDFDDLGLTFEEDE